MITVGFESIIRQHLNEMATAERQTVDAIEAARDHGVTWQSIADAFGHGDRAAAKRWYDRRA